VHESFVIIADLVPHQDNSKKLTTTEGVTPAERAAFAAQVPPEKGADSLP
jgi:hypothetical protein